jgi:hypothetical protein
MSRMLSLVTVCIAVTSLAVLATACGDSQPDASSSVTTSRSRQADVSSLDGPRLVDLHTFTLDARRPTRAFLRLDSVQRLRIDVLAKQPLQSCRVSQYADAGGSVIETRHITLADGREPYDNDLVRYSFATPRLEPGYYRIDLRGKGPIVSFAVDRRQ